jgi:hypothetical protein
MRLSVANREIGEYVKPLNYLIATPSVGNLWTVDSTMRVAHPQFDAIDVNDIARMTTVAQKRLTFFSLMLISVVIREDFVVKYINRPRIVVHFPHLHHTTSSW